MKRKLRLSLCTAVVAAVVTVGYFALPTVARSLYTPVNYHVWVDDSGDTHSLLQLNSPPSWVPWLKFVQVESSHEELVRLWPRAKYVFRMTREPLQNERMEPSTELLSRLGRIDSSETFVVTFDQRSKPTTSP